jgi:hypothetical protein
VDIISIEELKSMSMIRNGWHVSVFMPTHRAGSEIQQDPIRLKNLLGEAEERLVAAGVRGPEAREQLEPASSLIQDRLFWQQQSDGLAIFLSSEVARHYRVPLDLEASVVIAEQFHLKPLMPLLSGDGKFFVLALSQDEVRLLQGSRYSVGEIDLESVPGSLAEALRFDDPESRLQFHTASGPTGGRGGRPAMFYGQGAPSDDDKVDILRYFQELDAGVQNLLAGEQAPLVLAGVEYLLPLYHEANSYPHLIEEGIQGNPEQLSAKELHQRAWALVQPYLLEERDRASQRFKQLASTGEASDDLSDIVPAAYHGRVGTLFVAIDHQQWGTFDPTLNEVQFVQEDEHGGQDLLDLAAVHTLLNGGQVYAVEADKMPADEPLAALLRY